MILNLFSSAPEHPLADAKELKRVVSELTTANDFRAVDEVLGWLESLEHAEKFRADKLNEVVRVLDEAVQAHSRRLAREYLTSTRLSKMEERRYWTTTIDFSNRLATAYEKALAASALKDKAADGLKPHLPLIVCRILYSLAVDLKWTYFKYGPVPQDLWLRLGTAYLAAEKGKYADKSLQLYPGPHASTTATQEYLKALVLQASALDSLLPLDIELAEKLISHFLPNFVLSAQDRPDNLYSVDPAQGQPPKRLVKLPQASPTVRFIAPGKAHAEMLAMIHEIERGEVPPSLVLGGSYSPKVVLNVLRHVANYWAEKPPIRAHQRHPVKTRLSVLHGFDDCVTMIGEAPLALAEKAESWVVDNVSIGGFGALVPCQRDEWLRIGALLCVQPEGGDNWLLGVVRRYGKEHDTMAGVGIQTIAKQANVVELRPRGSLSYGVGSGIIGLAYRDSPDAEDMRLVLPSNTFDVRESLDAEIDGQMTLMSPTELVETGPDYEIARYRARIAQ